MRSAENQLIGSRAPAIDKGCWLVVAAYAFVYAGVILAAHGLPYALDNNESFSSLWHARNLHLVGWGVTHGLADEVFAWHPGASPFLHTHQGNFPRMFSFLLYEVGLRSIQAQIAATTFTIGLASVMLAYSALRHLGATCVAGVACLILITDYALFGQWQFNTYRVWYGFFFFGMLRWAVTFADDRPIPARSWFAGWLLFSAMFYGEYVFAAWVALLSAGLTALLTGRRIRRVATAWLTILAGAVTAATVLCAQLVSFMGWAGIRRDVAYTLKARNMGVDHDFAREVTRFYSEHHIVFWQNYIDAAPLRTAAAFRDSILIQHLQFYGSWTVAAAAIVLFGGWLGCIRFARSSWRLGALALVAAASAELLTHRQAWLGNSVSEPLTRAAGGVTPAWLGPLAFAGAVVCSGWWACGLGRSAARFRPGLVLLAKLSASALVAYTVVYTIFTGYVFSGYLNRQAPFLVFWTDLLLGTAVALVATAIADARRTFGPGLRSFACLPVGLGSLALAGFAVAWAATQSAYYRAIPPTGYGFLHRLSQPPYRGATFVTNVYPAPIADQTGAWAYAETALLAGRITLGFRGFATGEDDQYRWFADAHTNPAYLEPDFGIIVHQPGNLPDALEARFPSEVPQSALVVHRPLGIMGRVSEPMQWFVEDRLTAEDRGSYQIVKFDWDYPPYLRPLNLSYRAAVSAMNFDQRVALDYDAAQIRRRWAIKLEPAPAQPITGAGAIQIVEATVDGRPLISASELIAQGWTPAPTPTPVGATGQWPTSHKLAALALGERLVLRLHRGPGAGKVRVTINEMDRTFDLSAAEPSELAIALDSGQRYGIFTIIPPLSPGLYVETHLDSRGRRDEAEVAYAYAQQQGRAEAATRVRVYHEGAPERWQMADEILFLDDGDYAVRMDEFRRSNADLWAQFERTEPDAAVQALPHWLSGYLAQHPSERQRPGILSATVARSSVDGVIRRRVPLPPGLKGRLELSVLPGTTSKSGPEYFGLPFSSEGAVEVSSTAGPAVSVKLGQLPAGYVFPFGELHLRVQLPANRIGQAEPLISTGVENAGDFVYLVYADGHHLRVGFDHWFKGGPASRTIAVDYTHPHDFTVSLGSFYPSPDDPVFLGAPAAVVAALKSRVRITLDGLVILDSDADFYDVAPSQIKVGLNEIHGTTSNPRFTGEILRTERVWPRQAKP